MKRIVICCDGTWQRLGGPSTTNVVRTALAVRPEDRGTAQIVFHLDGVGAGRGTGRLAQAIDRYLGGALGHGLTQNIAEAYRLLVFNYSPGDEIYLMGFSRGAYTARSLAGLIRNSGILARRHADRLQEAVDLYRSRRPEHHPKREASYAFRARYAPGIYLGEDDLAWRRANLPGTDWSGAVPLTIRYLGVWDTVGARGIPGLFGKQPLLHRRYQFHDTALSSHVGCARHAVAIDERRRPYSPTLWDNLAELNAGARGPAAPYQQRWFPGVHGAVGGGGDDQGLSSLALLWILEGAERCGLACDAEARAGFAALGDHRGPLAATLAPPSLLQRIQSIAARDRAGPAAGNADALSESARLRWHDIPGYRPGPLTRVAALLDARTETAVA